MEKSVFTKMTSTPNTPSTGVGGRGYTEKKSFNQLLVIVAGQKYRHGE